MREIDAVTRAFARYADSFQTLDPAAALPHLDLPCTFVGEGPAHVMSSKAEALALLTTLMRGLQARGYARSEIESLHARPLSDRLALISVNRVRYTATGQPMERVGETYTLRHADGEWRIVVAVAHEPDNTPPL